MKYFIEPNDGLFAIKIPIEWQYKNVEMNYPEKSPYSFQLYENAKWAFQISCYNREEKGIPEPAKKQTYDSSNLDFLHIIKKEGEFHVHLWYTIVEDYFFMAKYIHDKSVAEEDFIKNELVKINKVLSTLTLISNKNRELALSVDIHEKFIASLAASFDIKEQALKNSSFIELIIVIASQIDAYLRQGIVLMKQIIEKSDNIEIKYLQQKAGDKPITERTIYKEARELNIISEEVFNSLNNLYNRRNEVVHRYIISNFKTRELYKISLDYEFISEKVRHELKKIEDLQFELKIGIYKQNDPSQENNGQDITLLHSLVNDKHLVSEFYRKISKDLDKQ